MIGSCFRSFSISKKVIKKEKGGTYELKIESENIKNILHNASKKKEKKSS